MGDSGGNSTEKKGGCRREKESKDSSYEFLSEIIVLGVCMLGKLCKGTKRIRPNSITDNEGSFSLELTMFTSSFPTR